MRLSRKTCSRSRRPSCCEPVWSYVQWLLMLMDGSCALWQVHAVVCYTDTNRRTVGKGHHVCAASAAGPCPRPSGCRCRSVPRAGPQPAACAASRTRAAPGRQALAVSPPTRVGCAPPAAPPLAESALPLPPGLPPTETLPPPSRESRGRPLRRRRLRLAAQLAGAGAMAVNDLMAALTLFESHPLPPRRRRRAPAAAAASRR